MRPLLVALVAALMLAGAAMTSRAQTAPGTDASPSSTPSDVQPQDEARRAALTQRVREALRLTATDPATETEWRAILREAELVWGPEHPMAAQQAIYLANTLRAVGKNNEALALDRRALAIIERRQGIERSPHVISRLASRIANELVTAQTDLREAERLLRISTQYNRTNLSGHIVETYTLARLMGDDGRSEEGLRLMRTMREGFERDDPNSLQTALSQYYFAQVVGTSGRHDEFRALDAAARQSFLRFWENASPEQRDQNRALVAHLLGEGFDLSGPELERRARRLIAATGNPESIDPDWRGVLTRFGFDSLNASRANDSVAARSQLLRFQIDANDPAQARVGTMWLLVTSLGTAGRNREAADLLSETIALNRQPGGNRDNTSIYLWALAEYYARLNRPRDAIATLNEMMRDAQAHAGSNGPFMAAKHEQHAQTLLSIDQPATAPALQALRIRQDMGVRGETLARATRRGQTQSARAAAALYVRALWEETEGRQLTAQQRADLFAAMQTLGASDASDALAAGAARIAANRENLGPIAAEWLSAQDRIAEIDAASLALATGQTPDLARQATLAEERASAERTRDAREQELRNRFPDFFALVSPAPAPLATVQAALGADEVLIIMTDGARALREQRHQRGFVLAVTREDVALAENPLLPEEQDSFLAALRRNVQGQTGRAPNAAARARAAQAQPFDRQSASVLYDALFRNDAIARLTRGKDRWTLAPQGALLSAPFAALVMEPYAGPDSTSDPAQLRATKWLGLERTLSVTPSIASLVAQRLPRTQEAITQTAFFGVGNPSFDGATNSERSLQTTTFFRNNLADVTQLRQLSRLPRTGPEIESLARALGATRADYVLGAEATETEIMRRAASGALGRAEVIAFATHGLVAGALENQAEPALALTPPAVATAADDGLLTASEAARLTLTARWVILSACDTAAGGRPDAEGLSGLARAFFYAGARTLLVSQWPVDDAAAEQLTTGAVLRQRDRTLPPINDAGAMRESMRTLALTPSPRDEQGATTAHPRVWAPFILVSGE